MPFCNRCGKQIFEGHNFCTHCGEILNFQNIRKVAAKDRIRWLIARIRAVVEGYVFFWLGPRFMMSLNEKFGLPILQNLTTKIIGAFMIWSGIVIFFYCWSLFKFFGEGTTQPSDPPRRIVINGLYRYTRNPIYIAWVIALFGAFLYFGHILLLIYTVLNGVALHLYILLREEPVLLKRFGEEYIRYTKSVPRWIPRLTPYREYESEC